MLLITRQPDLLGILLQVILQTTQLVGRWGVAKVVPITKVIIRILVVEALPIKSHRTESFRSKSASNLSLFSTTLNNSCAQTPSLLTLTSYQIILMACGHLMHMGSLITLSEQTGAKSYF